MVGLYRAGRRVLCCIRKWRIIEDERCRRDTGSDDECFNAEASPEVLGGIAFIVSFEVPLIPSQSERCVGHLDHEEVEVGIGGKPVAEMNMSWAMPDDMMLTCALASGRQVRAPCDTTISNEML